MHTNTIQHALLRRPFARLAIAGVIAAAALPSAALAGTVPTDDQSVRKAGGEQTNIVDPNEAHTGGQQELVDPNDIVDPNE